MASTSGASAAHAQAGYSARPTGSSALEFKDSAEAPAAAEAGLPLNAHRCGSLHDNLESLKSITAYIESSRRGSAGPIYDPLGRVLDETPREQPWSTLVCFAKGAEKDAPGKISRL